ncbi:bifunctional oligoribonuclease/PAP phosphatase NrnA [Haloferax mediterranei ATCC 33500]|uniref:Bifunctional oligoribonuclease/PAP phosphatase NrnA n=1 Tax=Haloferax mediterranei (strain ATCC 33500 / DSM 1411 / JCM 8866 / NBRC 14739 / NCIMB 2177 / R-4) TaxID=523841 RepID=I3R396_HALMT|nr:DHH family phosphoesterase [Haloferax mediterranei]AFK18706.1 phosphoesterase-like protein [Haloferax mediterranei ATCC 33500]AHZ21924.1 phosphoesterase [Haloferax mediterranei ATCC 33500]EMA03433.1 phosphoesterase-like protein [Haloferax mediterranei ATCC 33500]MDX5988803.1 DHH family phosphoesterase [Haloferax mediterranei ATCC 33500]QCQ75206.1 bifunctional oligoribonuclease/PAP phosphatase NrnA [Haloferax mediterranei ATCC 33500]
MVRRLVLGCGSVGGDLVGTLAARPGSVTVITDREGRAEDLRADGITATAGNPADPTHYPDDADIVVVGGQSSELNLNAAVAAHERFPEAILIVSLADDPEPSVREDIEHIADEIIDSRRIVTDRILDAVGTSHTERLTRLMEVLRNIDGPLAVVMHDNPDPDAIAAALALQAIAKRVNVESDVCYFGDISHQENRALVNLLDLDLRVLDEVPEDDEYAGYALVDHSRPGVNDRLPTDTNIDIVIDHHPPRAPVEAAYVDLRRGVGSTSTLLTEYLEQLGIVPGTTVATALLFGIRVDTNDFTREVSNADFEAAAYLVPHVDSDLLERVETPSMTSETMETLARAISNRDVRGDILTTNVGDIRERDALAQAADYLLGMEGVEVTVVYGLMDGTVYVSGRARGARVDLGETFREALGTIGSAGGHADMAGAQIPLGILADVGDDSRESLATIVTDIVAGQLFETLEYTTPTPELDIDVTFEYSLDE